MPHAQMVNNRNEEVASHCRRVAALARRVGGGLPVTERMEEAMATAAEIHENWVPFIVPKLLGAQASAQDCVVQALRILRDHGRSERTQRFRNRQPDRARRRSPRGMQRLR